MKRSNDLPEIGDWLRSHKPEVVPPPGLEGRILRALDKGLQTRKKPGRFWMWLALPPAFAALLIVLNVRTSDSTPVVEQTSLVSEPLPVDSLLDVKNPLLAESEALGRDLERVSGFVIHCLPSLNAPGP